MSPQPAPTPEAAAAAAATAATSGAAKKLPPEFEAVAKTVGGQSRQLLEGFTDYLQTPEAGRMRQLHQNFALFMMEDPARMETMATEAARIADELRKMDKAMIDAAKEGAGKTQGKDAERDPVQPQTNAGALAYLAQRLFTAPMRLMGSAAKMAGEQTNSMGAALKSSLSRWRQGHALKNEQGLNESFARLEDSAQVFAKPMPGTHPDIENAKRAQHADQLERDLESTLNFIRKNTEAVQGKAMRGEIDPKDAEAQIDQWNERARNALQLAAQSPNGTHEAMAARMREMMEKLEEFFRRLKAIFDRMFGREPGKGNEPAAPAPAP